MKPNQREKNETIHREREREKAESKKFCVCFHSKRIIYNHLFSFGDVCWFAGELFFFTLLSAVVAANLSAFLWAIIHSSLSSRVIKSIFLLRREKKNRKCHKWNELINSQQTYGIYFARSTTIVTRHCTRIQNDKWLECSEMRLWRWKLFTLLSVCLKASRQLDTNSFRPIFDRQPI